MRYLLLLAFLPFAANAYVFTLPPWVSKTAAASCGLCFNCKGYNGPGGPCYSGPGGPAYDGPGGACYAGPGGPVYAGPGGPCYDGPGGPCYSGPGGGKSCPAICQ